MEKLKLEPDKVSPGVLEYECALRSIVFADRPVKEVQADLKRALVAESADDTLRPPVRTYDFETAAVEVESLGTCALQVRAECEELEKAPDADKRRKLKSLLAHFYALTKADAYGVEHMSSVLDNLGDFKFISTVDFKKSYWQVGLTAESKPKTAFYCPGRGQFQFKVVPFGAINSGPGWMRVFDKVLAGSWIRPYIKNYIDDCFIGTPTLDLHFKVLEEFFRLLLAANLTPNWEKCKFLRSSFKILGYILDGKGLHPDPDKVSSILQLARPKNASEVKTFLGAVSYYRRFVNDFSTIVEPITKLTRKKNSFVWESDQEAAYTRILSLLVSDPIVRLTDFSRRFYLSTDANKWGKERICLISDSALIIIADI